MTGWGRGAAARIVEEPELFQQNSVRLLVRDDNDNYLTSDGTWLRGEEATESASYGLRLPAAVIEAIAVAIQAYQGHTSHADTEARVLREWLAVEQRRVDKALEPVR